MSKTIGFHYGFLADKFEKQANSQGFTLGKEAKRLQKLGDALVLCWMNNLITDAQYNAALKKLQMQIIKELKPKEVQDDE